VKRITPLKIFKIIELVGYYVVFILVLILLIFSVEVAFSDMVKVFHNPDEINIVNTLTGIFLILVMLELLDITVTYIVSRVIVVYKIIDVALIAVVREVFTYISPVNPKIDAIKAALLIAAAAVLGVVDYLQRRSERRRVIRRIVRRPRPLP